MRRLKIEKGLRLMSGSVELKVIDIEAQDGVVLEMVKTGWRHCIQREELERQLLSGELSVRPNNDVQGNSVGPVEMLPDNIRAAYERRKAYVLAIEQAMAPPACPPRSLVINDVIDHVAKKLGDPKPPRPNTLHDWHRAWRGRGKVDSVLVPNYRARGRKKTAVTGETADLIDEALNELYLIQRPPTLKRVITGTIDPLLRLGSQDLRSNVHMVSDSSIYRYVSNLDPYTVAVAHEGREAADARYRYLGKGYEAEAPLDLVYSDYNNMPVFIPVPNTDYVIRPWLFAAIDVYSAMPWASYISFDSPSFAGVAAGLKLGIFGHDDLLASMPTIEHRLPPGGLFREMGFDLGVENRNRHIREAFHALGLDATYMPKASPTAKARVERFFKTLNEDFVQGLPGRTVRIRRPDGGYDAVKEASIPYEVFREQYYKWLVDIYCQRYHQTLKESPINRWNEGVQRFPIDLPADPDFIRLQLCEHLRPQLRQCGIRINNTLYASAELHEIYKRNKAKPLNVEVRLDPSDLGYIYVIDPQKHKVLKVFCNDEEFRLRDKWSHKTIRRIENAKKKRINEKAEIGRHMQAISAAVSSALLTKPKKTNRVAARAALRDQKLQECKENPALTTPVNLLVMDQETQSEIDRLRVAQKCSAGGEKDVD